MYIPPPQSLLPNPPPPAMPPPLRLGNSLTSNSDSQSNSFVRSGNCVLICKHLKCGSHPVATDIFVFIALSASSSSSLTRMTQIIGVLAMANKAHTRSMGVAKIRSQGEFTSGVWFKCHRNVFRWILHFCRAVLCGIRTFCVFIKACQNYFPREKFFFFNM